MSPNSQGRGDRALVVHGWADLALIDRRGDCFAVGEDSSGDWRLL